MKKFAAHYLLDATGVLLKHGMLEIDDSGNLSRIWDTHGNLHESSQLVFLNGILIPDFYLLKSGSVAAGGHFVTLFPDENRISVERLVEVGKIFQEQFPEKNIRHFFSEVNELVHHSGNYKRVPGPGVFLLMGADLVKMKFTPKSRLKRLL